MSSWDRQVDRRPLAEADGCPECAQYVSDQPLVIGACASVGIEHGKTTSQMLREYLRGYHTRGHDPR